VRDPGDRVLRADLPTGKGPREEPALTSPLKESGGKPRRAAGAPDEAPDTGGKPRRAARAPEDAPDTGAKPRRAARAPDEAPTPRRPVPRESPSRLEPPGRADLPAVTDPEEADPARLVGDLVRAPGARQGALVEKLRDAKGVASTEALATAIPQLSGDAREKARAALVERLARMSAEALGPYLEDEDVEIRRAAALACARKEDKAYVPRLIRLLADPEPPVAEAAHKALTDLTGQDLGPAPEASRAERARAVAAWEQWWKRRQGDE
jgi:hypothetical protein